MQLQLSVAVRNAKLDAIETSVGVSGKLQIYSGTMPADCATAVGVGNTKLVEYALASDWAANASAGSKNLNSLPLSVAAVGAGTGSFFRLVASDGTTCGMQGDVSYSAAAWINSTAYVLGQKVTNNGNVYNCSQAGTSAVSGGPSGTGTAIVDGAAKWDYVSVAGVLTLDNTVITIGQTVTVSTFAVTEGNA